MTVPRGGEGLARASMTLFVGGITACCLAPLAKTPPWFLLAFVGGALAVLAGGAAWRLSFRALLRSRGLPTMSLREAGRRVSGRYDAKSPMLAPLRATARLGSLVFPVAMVAAVVLQQPALNAVGALGLDYLVVVGLVTLREMYADVFAAGPMTEPTASREASARPAA